MNRGSEEFFPGKLSELCVQLGPAVDTTGDGNWQGAMTGDDFETQLSKDFGSQRARRTPARIQPVKAFRLRIPDDREQVAPIPLPVGSTKPSSAFAAIAASIAFPPRFRMSTAT